MRKLTAAAVVAALCIALTACTPGRNEATPDPTFTPIPTTSPSPGTGPDAALASTKDYSIGYPVYLTVYNVKAWNAAEGCNCSAPGEDGELFTAGAPVWAIRVELEAHPNWNADAGVDAAGITLASSWGPGVPVPVLAEEGKALAEEQELPWGFASAQTPATFLWGETRSFLLAVYVPRGAVSLQFQLDVPPTASEGQVQQTTVELEVELPQSVIDVMYTGEQGE